MILLHRSLKFGESCKKEDTKKLLKLLHPRVKKMFSVDRKKNNRQDRKDEKQKR